MLVESLTAWDGSVAHAEALREQVAAAGPLRGKPLDGERGLAKLRAAKPGSGCSLACWLAENPEESAVVAPLIGIQALEPWPWTDPLAVGDEHAAAGLALLGRHRVVVDPAIRRFLRVFYREIRRPLWTAAARALALQATADAELAGEIQRWWSTAFPDRMQLTGGNTRARRHALLLGAHAHGLGNAPEGFSVETLLKMAPKDDADRSLVALARVAVGEAGRSVELVEGSRYPLTLRTVVGQRGLLDDVDGERLREKVEQAGWEDTDALLAVEDGRAQLGLPSLLPDEQPCALEIAERLGRLFDPGRGPLIPREERAREVVVLLRGLRQPEVAQLPWGLLAAAAGAPVPSLHGPAGATGPAAIGGLTALAGWPVQHLLREAALDRESVLQLAPVENGFVSTQLAIQLERHLRQSADDAERVRLLWRLMVADPPSETFEKLALRIRSEVDPGERGQGPMIELVEALHELDRHRDQGTGLEGLLPSMRRVAGAVGAVLDREHPLDRLLSLLDGSTAEPITAGLQAFAELFGPDEHGLVAWSCWVDDRQGDRLERSERLGRELTELQRATRVMIEARPHVAPAHLASVRGASRSLREEVLHFGWPEKHGLNALLDQLLAAAEGELEQGYRSAERAVGIERCLQLGDERGLVAWLREPDAADLLGVSELRRVHRFLLQQLRFRDADRLRARVAGRVALPSVSSQLLPIFAAVVGGSFLVLDFGSKWIELAADWAEPRVLAITGMTLFLSYLVLLVTLGSRMSDARGPFRRWLVVAGRIAPTWLAALLVATGSAALVLGTLDETWTKLPVFVSLQLFLGVFVGLVLQGQPVLAADGD